jgi:hypothetical protein
MLSVAALSFQAAHDAAAAELQELQRSAAAGQAATDGEAAAVKAGDEAAYAAEHAELAKQVRCCAVGDQRCLCCLSVLSCCASKFMTPCQVQRSCSFT